MAPVPFPIQISRFVDDHQPGFVECVLLDAFGKAHVFIEKVPVVTTENLLPTGTYPTAGTLDCEIVAEWTDDSGRALMRIDTERPWGVESTEGLTQFVVAGFDPRLGGGSSCLPSPLALTPALSRKRERE